jgi:Tfp pilus assembly protein PilZ
MREACRKDRRIPAAKCRADVRRRRRVFFTKTISYSRKLVDISEGGVQVYHETRLPKGARVSVRIRHPRSYSETHLRGNVAWSMPSGLTQASQRYAIGVQFQPMSTGEITKVRRLMKTILGFVA